MNLLRTAAAAGAATLIYRQVRKPENQQKLKAFVDSFTDSRNNRGSEPR